MTEIDREAMGADHYGILYGDVVPAGAIDYGNLYVVFQRGVRDAVLVVASEVNTTASLFGGGSHFLCVYDDEGHANLGASDAYGDVVTFTTKALDIVTERLGIPRGPVE